MNKYLLVVLLHTFYLASLISQSYPFRLISDRTTESLLIDVPHKSMKDKFQIFSDESYLTVSRLNLNLNYNNSANELTESHILIGDLNPHFYLFNKTGSFLRNLLIDINPHFVFRILDQFSGPVRTPSANPGFKLYYFADKWEKTKIKKAITIGYYHLSNGQDAHPLADSVKLDPKFAYINQGKHFNRYNGNFSTNYLTFGFNLFWDKEYDTPKSTKINVVSSRLFRNLNYPELPLSSTVSSFSINTELHTKNFGNSNIAILAYEPELIGYYSFLRAGLTYKLIRTYNSEIINGLAKTINQREYDRFKIYVNVALDKINKLPNYDFFSRINAEISYHMRLPYSDFVSWYAKMGFYGSDPYNIYLEDRIFYAQLGLAIGSFIF